MKYCGLVQLYHVYIMTNKYHTVLYVGITGDLKKRVYEHKSGQGSDFTIKYKINKLVYAEYHTLPDQAIKREKQIKKWGRQKKIKLIESMNPNWDEIEVI